MHKRTRSVCYDFEVELIAEGNKLGMLTAPYVFNSDDAVKMAEAGADVLVAHVGLTTKGSVGAKSAMTLDQAAELVQKIADAGKSVNPDVLIICHGGPIAEPEDAAYILQHTRGAHGFFGASSIERLPTEIAITRQVERFKEILRRQIGDGELLDADTNSELKQPIVSHDGHETPNT